MAVPEAAVDEHDAPLQSLDPSPLVGAVTSLKRHFDKSAVHGDYAPG